MPDFSGLFDYVHGKPYKRVGVNALKRNLLQRLQNSDDGQAFSAKVNALSGLAVGAANVVVRRTRVVARRQNENPNAGIVPIVTTTIRNSPSTAADNTEVRADLIPPTDVVFPKDLSGNGGGGRKGGTNF